MWKRIVVGATVLTAIGIGGTASATGADATDPEQVRAFFDERLPQALERQQTPGAAVAVVAGGRQVVANGYGVANTKTKQRVRADRTLFPIDSTSKLFTATAVMQLVEQGKVDLHTDVNTYLAGTKVSVPDTFEGKPITLAHLLTHSAGFEELNAGTFAGTDADHPSFEAYLAEHQPRRVRAPGILPAYSNYGIGLAGFVVQAQSKVPFEEYVEQHILQPLGMKHTTFDQPPAETLKRDLASGHRPDGNRNVPVDDGYDNVGPAGAAVATVTDLSSFMLAHLGVDQERILEPETAKLMHGKQFAPDGRLPGMAYGFYEGELSGERVIQHGGDGAGTHGLLTLIPERNTGIYVVVNGDGLEDGAAVVERITHEFVEHFYPKPKRTPKATPADGVEQFAGTYRYSRISDTDISRGFAIMQTTIGVDANVDGTLTTNGRMTVDPDKVNITWVPVGDRLFQEEGGTGKLAFTPTSDGTDVMSLGEDPTVGWTKLRWYEQPSLHLAIIAGSLFAMLTMLAWPVIALVRRRRASEGRPARLLAGAMLLLLVAFLGGLAYYLTNLNTFIDDLLAGSTALNTLLTLPLIAAALGIGVIASAVIAWRKGWWSTVGRVQYSAIALAVLGFFTVAYEYNFLAWPW